MLSTEYRRLIFFASLESLTLRVLVKSRAWLSEPEAKEVLAAYGIPILATRIASSAEPAVAVAAEIGFPVAVKILASDLTHKSDVGGVQLDLEGPAAVRAAAQAMRERVTRMLPGSRILGFTVEPMARRPVACELIVGVAADPTFGPSILF